jgi:hypothetical protein
MRRDWRLEAAGGKGQGPQQDRGFAPSLPLVATPRLLSRDLDSIAATMLRSARLEVGPTLNEAVLNEPGKLRNKVGVREKWGLRRWSESGKALC